MVVPDPSSAPADAQPPSIARELIVGAVAAAIALGCFLPPLVHFVPGPLGPFIAGFIPTSAPSASNTPEPEPQAKASTPATK